MSCGTTWDILEFGDGEFVVDPAVFWVEAVGLAVSCWDLAVGRTGCVLEEAAASVVVEERHCSSTEYRVINKGG